MDTFVLLDSDNKFIRTQEFSDSPPQLSPLKGLSWHPWLEVDPPAVPPGTKLLPPVVIEIDGVFQYDWITKEFSKKEKVQLTEKIRADKNIQINEDRKAANSKHFTYQGKTISCDPLSRSNLDGMMGYLILFGEFPEFWPGVWKSEDNSHITIETVDQFKEMYSAMIMQGLANFSNSEARKAALAAAASYDEIKDI